ncbi:MAG: hypothetical protein R3208_12270 [Ketobacteraceae bacterium]|nr:hypothetical protein [Ketobacteraceae bacterium]
MLLRLTGIFWFIMLSMPLANADEIENTIKEANAAYHQGNYQLTLDRLEQAMNLVKDVQAAAIINYFPKPLPGWDIVKGQSGAASPIPNVQLGMFSSVIQRYRKTIEEPDGENLLESDSKKKQDKVPWVQFTLVQKPGSLIKMGFQGAHALRASHPDSRSVTVDGYSGIVYCDKKEPSCDAFFDFDGNFMLMVNAEHVSRDEMEAYVKAFDVSGLLSGG